MRRLLIFLIFASAAFGATIRLYLKDGTYEIVREYQVVEDRVKYYSTERSDWEEIPVELVDLNRTKKEVAAREDTVKAEAKAEEEEDAALRAAREEVKSVPDDPGVYYIHGAKLEPVKSGEVKIVTDKKRNILTVISPIPIVPGRSTLEMDGETSPFKIMEERPEFYFRLSNIEGFAMIKLDHKKGLRIIESVSTLKITQESEETRKEVATFKKQVGEQLYKIWPEQPLEAGEYALIQFTEGAVNVQVWDFSVGK